MIPPRFRPLPLGSVLPSGWLARQLRLQADGLSGHLDELWPDVAQSAWIGGSAEGWERGPYWLDGLVPLAFLLGDMHLIGKATRWVDAILARQQPDGWLGPLHDRSDPRRKAYDPWPVFVALKALLQYQEATGDTRIVPSALRFLRRLDTLLDQQPLFDWGRYRWGELAWAILWLHERQPEPWLLDLAAKAYRQSFDWRELFERDPFPYAEKQRRAQIHPPALPEPGITFRTDLASHVVNLAMALKQPALWYRFTGDPADRDAPAHMLAMLDQYHGQAAGVFSGDEHLAGRGPAQGTELCAVVELLFSLELLVATIGDPALADRLEFVVFNALPATLSPDMWSHQYVQQANQVRCAVANKRVYTNNGPDANLFGLEPNYGCCTANMHQGWPKFAASLWAATSDHGLAALAYSPCVVSTAVAGCPVRVTVATDYPFDETIRITVAVPRSVRFPLQLRVPSWAVGASLRLDDGPPEPLVPGSFALLEREWQGTTTLTLHFPMALATERRCNQSVALSRGPLRYALRIAETWHPVAPLRRSGPTSDARVAHDYELHPAEPWNLALALDPARPEDSLRLVRRPLGALPFSPQGAPVELHGTAYLVPGWGLAHGAAAPPPPPPVTIAGPPRPVVLIPYGCTNLRLTELPLAPPGDAQP